MSDEPEVEVRWAKGPDFAEVAETLDIETSQVCAVRSSSGPLRAPGGDWYVLFTQAPDETLLHGVRLKRDADGVLQLASIVVPMPGLWEQLIEGLAP